MYDDYNIRKSNMIMVANVVFDKADLPADIDLDGAHLSSSQILGLLEDDNAVTVSTALIEKDTLNHLDEMLEELTVRYLQSGTLDGYNTIEHSVALNPDKTRLFILSLVD